MAKTVMISSTSLDLPEHRKAVIEACIRYGCLPLPMEYLPARNADAIKVSMEMVEKADVYVGIFAWRYGHIPKGHKISITEMEFNRAVDRGIEILIFLMHEDHPITKKMVEPSEAAQKKLEALKARASTGRIREEFKSVDNLQYLVGQALAAYKEREPETAPKKSPAAANLAQARQNYLDWLRHSCESVELLGLDLKLTQNVRLGQVYVPAVVAQAERLYGAAAQALLGPAHDLLLDRLGRESLYVPGPPGSGKSTFCRWLALCTANGAVPAHAIPVENRFAETLPEVLQGRFPMLCHLRDWVLSDAPWIKGNGRWTQAQLENALAAWLDHTHPGGLREVFLDELKQGRCMLILDGVDEVPETAKQDRDHPRDNLLTGLAHALPEWIKAGNRVLLTSRPYGVTNAQRHNLGIASTPLENLPDALQQTFIRRWYAAADPPRAQEKAVALSHHLSERRDLDELRPNPMLLTALCVKFDEGQRLPSDFYRLFKAVIEQVLHMRYPRTQPRERAYTRLTAVALAMHSGVGGNNRATPLAAVSHDEVDQALAAHAALATATEPGADQARAMREDLLSNSGLLLPRTDKSAGFYHLIFQDFFAADRARRIGGDLAALLDRHAAVPEWRRTLTFLFCAVADEVSAERAVELYSGLLHYFEPAALSAKPAAALLLADCLEVAHARGWNLERFAQPLRGACEHALDHLPPSERAHLWRTLGSLGLDERRGVGARDGLPDIDWVEIPKGVFIFGDEKGIAVYGDEKPHEIPLHAFRIARYPITNVQYECFINDGGYDDQDWWKGLVRSRQVRPRWNYPNHPREMVSWHEASAFCRWLDARLRDRGLMNDTEQLRLPTEREWEKAARSSDGREYPWGAYADGRANINETFLDQGRYNLGRTSAVGIYPAGASPYGLQDMAGNVWEWCDDRHNLESKSVDDSRVLRGGSWGTDRGYCRCACRRGGDPGGSHNGFVGFRVCVAPPIR